MEHRYISSHFYDDTSLRYAVNINVQQLFPHMKNHRYALNERRDLRTRLDGMDKGKIFYAFRGSEKRSSRP